MIRDNKKVYEIAKMLQEKGISVSYTHLDVYKRQRLYRILFNEEMYYIAYERIYAKQGNMTKGVDGKTIDGFSISHVEDVYKRQTKQNGMK